MKKLYTILLASVFALSAAAQTTPTKMKITYKTGFSEVIELSSIEDITFIGDDETIIPDNPAAQGVFEINIPATFSFDDSKVYKVVAGDNITIAEVCLEYINTEDAQKVVIYPCDSNGDAILTKGFSLTDGGTVVWDTSANTCTYTAGTGPVNVFYYKDGNFFLETDVEELEQTTINPYQVVDKRNPLDVMKYAIVKIGTQYWMADNLKATLYKDGSPITNYDRNQVEAWANTTQGAYHVFADNDDAKDIYGVMYNAYAFTDSRGLAPDGWDVPEGSDFSALKVYLGSQSGNKMKMVGGWDIPTDIEGNLISGYEPTDVSGFSGAAGGCFSPVLSTGDGGDSALGSRVYYWTKTAATSTYSSGYLWASLYFKGDALTIAASPRTSNYGHYIRCIRK